MQDIYDIKDMMFDLPISIPYTLLILGIFIIGYLVFFRKKISNNIIITEVILKENPNYTDLIEKFDYTKFDSKTFLREISFLLRNYLEDEIGYKDFSKLTLKEILKLENIDIEYLNSLKDIYYKEYKETELTEEEKKYIFQKVKEILKKSYPEKNNLFG